jgi:N-carbamoylputrescine amidase
MAKQKIKQGSFRVAVIQMKCSSDPKKSMAAALKHMETAVKKGAKIICTPELFLTEYFCQSQNTATFDLAETIPGPSTETLGKFAKKHGVVIVASLFEKRARGLYHNTVVVIETDGSILGKFRKMHIPDDPLYYEKYYFTPGDLGFKVFKTSFGNIGTLICWDQWYPEAARITALMGADVIFYPTAIGHHPSEKKEWGTAVVDAWQTVQRGHAIANGVYVAVPNRIGHEGKSKNSDGIEFFGNSFIADPYGRFIAKASDNKEEVLVADIDTDFIEQKRRNWPHLRDRRIDAYGPILKRYANEQQ